VTDADGKSTSFGYDALGRLTSVSGADGTATYAYDEADNRVSQTDALGHITQMRYDAQNRLVERRYPGGETERFAYDAAGELVSRTDSLGRTTTFVHDETGNVVRRILPGGATVDVTYAADGQRASVVDARGTTTYAYDAAGRVASIVDPDGATLTYAYDASGNLASLASPSGTVSYQFDALDRMSRMTAPEGTTTYAHDLAGNVVRRTAPNGVTTDIVFDTRDRPTSIVQASGATTLQSFAMTWSPAGRRTGITELGGSKTVYAYDAQGRLAAETRTGSHPYTVTHAYDAAGNRTQSVRDGVATTFTYDADDRLLQAGSTTYAWDANGNLASRTAGGGVTQFGFDAESRLVSLQGGGYSEQYAYDADGHRVRATDASGSTRFLVDTMNPTGYAQVIEERDTTGTLVARQAFDAALASTTRSGAVRHVLADPLGSVRALTDSAGAITDRTLDDAYGVPVDSDGATPNPYRYRGERVDAAGLYDLRARAYDPAAGRFLSRDPFAGNVEAPLSLHRYLYANGDPANRVDPSGAMSLPEISIVTQIFAGLAVANSTATFLGGVYSGQGVTLSAINAGEQLLGELIFLGASEFVIGRVLGPIVVEWAGPAVKGVLGRLGSALGLTTSAAAAAEAWAGLRGLMPIYARLEAILAQKAAGKALTATSQAEINIAENQIAAAMKRLSAGARRAAREAVEAWKKAPNGSEISKGVEDTVRISENEAWESFCDMILKVL
jgi:RHS repeat-associated protein